MLHPTTSSGRDNAEKGSPSKEEYPAVFVEEDISGNETRRTQDSRSLYDGTTADNGNSKSENDKRRLASYIDMNATWEVNEESDHDDFVSNDECEFEEPHQTPKRKPVLNLSAPKKAKFKDGNLEYEQDSSDDDQSGTAVVQKDVYNASSTESESSEDEPLDDVQKEADKPPAEPEKKAFERKSATQTTVEPVMVESGTSIVGGINIKKFFACASALIMSTPAVHLVHETSREIHDVLLCGVPIFVPSNPDKNVYVSLEQLPTFLAYFHGKPNHVEIDTRFFLALGPLMLLETFMNQPQTFNSSFVGKLKRRIGSGLDYPPETRVLFPQTYSVIHGFRRTLRKKNKGGCTSKNHGSGKTFDSNMEIVGLNMCTDCSGVRYRKTIESLLQNKAAQPWILQMARKLQMPNIMNIILGSALLRMEAKESNFDHLSRFSERWVYRAAETCFGNPNIVGILWKLHIFTDFGVCESINLGHQHWALQQIDSEIGETLGSMGCSCLIPKKGPLMSSRKSFEKFTGTSSEFFSSIVEERYGTDIRYMHVGAIMSLAAVSAGLLKVVICASPVGFEAFMGCNSKDVQEVDFRMPDPEIKDDVPIILGKFGHMITFRALLKCAMSKVSTLVLIVDYPIMLFGYVHPKFNQPMGGCCHALYTMACISWAERLLGHRNPEIINTGFVHQHDDELSTRCNEGLEDATRHCILGTSAGVDYIKGNYPDFGKITAKFGIQPFLKDVGCSRALVGKATNISKKFRGKPDTIKRNIASILEGYPWLHV